MLFAWIQDQMKIPLYVLDPRGFSEEKFFQGKEPYVQITEIESGSELAQAVVRLEWQREASHDRLRQIATYLGVRIE